MLFNEKIKEQRIKKGWSQEQLATQVHVSRQAVTKWENGDGYPDIENLKILSDLFDISIDELVKDDFNVKENERLEIITHLTKKIKIKSTIRTIEIHALPIETIRVIPTNHTEITANLISNHDLSLAKNIILNVKKNNNKIKIQLRKDTFFSFKFLVGAIRCMEGFILEIHLPTNYANNLKVDAIVNHIDLENLNLNKIKIVSVNSEILLNQVKTEQTELHQTDGDITLKEFEGNLQIDAMSSDIIAQYKSFEYSIKTNCISSNIKIEIPKNASYYVTQDNISSDIKFLLSENSTNPKASKNKIKLSGLDNTITIKEF